MKPLSIPLRGATGRRRRSVAINLGHPLGTNTSFEYHSLIFGLKKVFCAVLLLTPRFVTT